MNVLTCDCGADGLVDGDISVLGLKQVPLFLYVVILRWSYVIKATAFIPTAGSQGDKS